MSAGQFATARRPGLGADLAFINRLRARGAPDTAIARMAGWPLSRVRALPPVTPLAARAAPQVSTQKIADQPLAAQPLAMRVKRVGAILGQVAERHQVTVEALIGPGQGRAVAQARQEAYARIRQQGGYSLARIGALMGGRDHTTVLHGIRAHGARAAGAASAARAERGA